MSTVVVPMAMAPVGATVISITTTVRRPVIAGAISIVAIARSVIAVSAGRARSNRARGKTESQSGADPARLCRR